MVFFPERDLTTVLYKIEIEIEKQEFVRKITINKNLPILCE